MDITRRTFASRLGMLITGATVNGAWVGPTWVAGSPASPLPQHPEHSKLPMTTHASGNDENKLAAAEDIWTKLMEGNARFVSGKLLARDVVARRAALLTGQQPNVVVLGCSDSRVTPSVIFDQELGDIFEIRTAGNVVDAVGLGSIEYALIHLPIRVVVILGHEKCGVVKAAASGQKTATKNLQAVVDRITPALAKVPGDHNSQEFLRKAEEANVIQCAKDLLADSPVVLQESAANNIEIIKAMYNFQSGEVRRL